MTENTTFENEQAWLNRILFLCKRGNLETELLLSAYAPTLIEAPNAQKQVFESLLEQSDQHLFAWLLNTQDANSLNPSVPAEYRLLIQAIRNNYLILNQ